MKLLLICEEENVLAVLDWPGDKLAVLTVDAVLKTDDVIVEKTELMVLDLIKDDKLELVGDIATDSDMLMDTGFEE